MSWFKRTSNSQVQDDYLQTTDTVSRPMATIFTIIIVLVLAAVAFSLFLGGRWLFQNLDGSNKPKVQIVENPITETTPNAASTSGGGDAQSGAASSSAGNGVTSTNNGSNNSPAAQSSSAGTGITNTPTASQAGAAVAAVSIPATGPRETITLFVITVTIATIIHSVWLRRRVRN